MSLNHVQCLGKYPNSTFLNDTFSLKGNLYSWIFIFLLLLNNSDIKTEFNTPCSPDFYAVKMKGDVGYKVFQRVGDCPVYRRGDNRVLLYQEGKHWKIGNLLRSDRLELDCQNLISSVAEVLYEVDGLPGEGKSWIDSNMTMKAKIGIKSFKKCEEIQGFQLDTEVAAYTNILKEDCYHSEFWGEKFQKETFFASFFKSRCYYSPEQNVILREETSANFYIHSSCGTKSAPAKSEKQPKNSENESGSNPVESKNTGKDGWVFLLVFGFGIICGGCATYSLYKLFQIATRKYSKKHDKRFEIPGDLSKLSQISANSRNSSIMKYFDICCLCLILSLCLVSSLCFIIYLFIPLLGIAYIVVGCSCLVSGVIFLFIHTGIRPSGSSSRHPPGRQEVLRDTEGNVGQGERRSDIRRTQSCPLHVGYETKVEAMPKGEVFWILTKCLCLLLCKYISITFRIFLSRNNHGSRFRIW